MVLDAKALSWAAKNNIDTAKLKAAKVPIYGKWYFPEIPADIPLINLETGERRVFAERMLAGEVIWVAEDDLRKAGLLPEKTAAQPAAGEAAPGSAPGVKGRGARVPAPEPLLAISRPPGLEVPGPTPARVPTPASALAVPEPTGDLAGIHLPRPSIAPFVLGVGFCIALLGAITNPVILVVGLLWMLFGAITWIRIGLLELGAAEAHQPHGEHGTEHTPKAGTEP